MTTRLKALRDWVAEVAELTSPDRIHWCDGSEQEYRKLIDEMLDSGTLLELNQQTYPGCYLHRSDPDDVARVEHLTFVCTHAQEDAGPNNNWKAPAEAKELMKSCFAGCMRGRTMYVIPYCMGPIDSPYARCGVEITDSPYVVANMYLMTRIGKPALKRIEKDKTFVKGLHSTGELNPERRYIVHFPEELTIMSYGSGYGGNALLGKKCHALRIASYQARTEGWLAEHMLIVGVQSPAGDIHYLACAFPSACGKTNLAMLIPPESHKGWKVWTLGDDIAWMHLDKDGQLRAINPEAGYFGVVPGTNPHTNKNAYDTIQHDTIFTNVAVTADNDPWWEEKGSGKPTIDWLGKPYDAKNGPAAHPNSRFTVSAKQNPAYSKLAEAPEGVPISALVFGGRRRELAPLVYQAKDWAHGVLVGASVASETTAAATGKVGVVRRDPMAMKPFCGYNYGDYWAHWLSFGKRSGKLPKIFHVNWFRRDSAGKFLWPGYGENLRVLRWIIDRCENRVGAIEKPIGFLPKHGDIDVNGLDVSSSTLEQLLAVDPEQWRAEMKSIGEYFAEFGTRLPSELSAEHQKVVRALG
ncbi:MAG TPA: phosphoenolpyruvate carboxykinase (GTP) [Gammaproteobacteria bacterium]|jgi:phosphoenolpyruvate carboxykinase (GTP)|nr:phosphoenolpyruvate carboxykinase (GTP) [Gammaproteobacteria bacterium]